MNKCLESNGANGTFSAGSGSTRKRRCRFLATAHYFRLSTRIPPKKGWSRIVSGFSDRKCVGTAARHLHAYGDRAPARVHAFANLLPCCPHARARCARNFEIARSSDTGTRTCTADALAVAAASVRAHDVRTAWHLRVQRQIEGLIQNRVLERRCRNARTV